MVPPHVSPTENASSSEYPKVMTPRSRSPASTSRAALTTAPSTHPPETEPETSPSSLTAMVAPGSRGADPSSATTRATATRWPPARQRSMSSSTSFICSPAHLFPGDEAGQCLQRRQVVALDELVNVRQGGRHSACQG